MVLVIVIKVVHIDCVEFCRGILKYLDVAVFLANFVLVCFTIFVFLVLLILLVLLVLLVLLDRKSVV